jgi:hypothetical protein
MKYAKMLGLLAVAAAALMAFAGSASATTLTAPSGTTYTSSIHAVNEGNLTLEGENISVTCTGSTVQGTVESHGSGVTVKGNISELTFTGCNQHVTVVNAGSLEIHNIAGTNDGTLTSSGATVTILFTTIFGNIHCSFATNNTDIGRLTAAPSNEGHATLDIGKEGETRIPVESGSFLCGNSAKWVGFYKVDTPTGLKVDA